MPIVPAGTIGFTAHSAVVPLIVLEIPLVNRAAFLKALYKSK